MIHVAVELVLDPHVHARQYGKPDGFKLAPTLGNRVLHSNWTRLLGDLHFFIVRQTLAQSIVPPATPPVWFLLCF